MKSILFLWMILTCGMITSSGGELPSKPNIIFILTDDQGYGDLSVHGNPVLKTPNLDKLHSESVRFTDFHVSPTCAPTRSALLTGRHEFRNGVTHTIYERERLNLKATTLPEVLLKAGYQTGIFGKWHLGDEAEYQPGKRGFQETFIHGAGGIGQSYPGSCGDAPGNTYFDPFILHNNVFEKTKGYCTDIFFEHAIHWMEKVKSSGPFYCHLATNAPHTPLQVRPEDEAPYAGKVPANTAKYFGMVANIDENVGRLLAKLEDWGIANNTLVVFMTDNGGTGGVSLWNAGMRGAKGTPWLGGTRAISFWRWPGLLIPGDRGQLTAHLDFFPTLAAIAGARLDDAAQKQIEGRSLVPLLTETDEGKREAAWPDRTLFTHVGRWDYLKSPITGKYKNCSVRTRQWHLVSLAGKETKPAWQLYDLNADFGEKIDVSSEHPEVVLKLSEAFENWWDDSVPLMVNEMKIGPETNPFKTLFQNQFPSGHPQN